MGVVYEAEDLRLGRHVALKFLPEEVAKDRQALERFQREARAASALDHPNICTFTTLGKMREGPSSPCSTSKGKPSSTRSLENRWRSRRCSIWHPDRRRSGRSTFEGIVHRDIKPRTSLSRIEASEDSRFRARQSHAESGKRWHERTDHRIREHLTSPGSTLGTVAYMSPEQVRGKELDTRSDLFSFGAVLYEMCTGMLPFRGETSGLIFKAILDVRPTSRCA